MCSDSDTRTIAAEGDTGREFSYDYSLSWGQIKVEIEVMLQGGRYEVLRLWSRWDFRLAVGPERMRNKEVALIVAVWKARGNGVVN